MRGFGTAVMHGGTTAIFAIVSKSRRVSLGLTIAFILHSLFNHFILSPAMSTLVIVLILPPLLVMVFAQSESLLREWIGTGFDFNAELLQVMNSGPFAESRAGQYLQSLRDHFDGAVLADMLCFLRLQTELSLRAKGVLMLRENGFPVKKDAEVGEKLGKANLTRSEALRDLASVTDKLSQQAKEIGQSPAFKPLERAAREPGGSAHKSTTRRIHSDCSVSSAVNGKNHSTP